MNFTFTGELWLYPGKAAWHFITLPHATGQQVKFFQGHGSGGGRRGFGAVRVIATIGKTAWTTSIFPDSKSGSYLLPVKADVRRAEKLTHGSLVTVSVTLNEI
jgi:Domain of unknown function (DUF1905)